MKLSALFALAPLAILGARAAATSPVFAGELARYGRSVAWTTPSKNSEDSMPLPGYNLGINAWVEGDSLCLLVGGPDIMDANGMQVKLGLLRLKFPKGVFARDFRQEPDLVRGEIVVRGATDSGKPVVVRLWCAGDRKVFHAEIASETPLSLEVEYGSWSGAEVLPAKDGLLWVKRLPENNPRRLRDMKAQGMEEFAAQIPDPLSRLTLGGRIVAPGLVDAGTGETQWNGMKLRTATLRTAVPVTALDLCVTLRAEQDASKEVFVAELEKSSALAASGAREDRAKALARWDEFWNRSHLVVNPGAPETDKVWQAGRNYQLIRQMLAGNPSGRAPTLFNGGLFPCSGNPDSRNWDGCQFMAQNQRLVYWPMLRSGDADMLGVALDFYRDRTAMSRSHAKKFWGVDGVAWSEAFGIFGLDAIGVNKEGRCSPRHLNFHHTSGLEFALMMLESGRYFGRDITDYLPAVEGWISYYDLYYQNRYEKTSGKRLDAAGKLVIYPSDACEPLHGCTNNTDVIAGLWALSSGLLDLPERYLTPEKRAYYREFQKRIPPLPIREKDGRRFVDGAEKWEWVFHNGNMDFPNMYTLFPFGYFAVGRPGPRGETDGMELAKNTWDLGAISPAIQHQNQCWYQSAINLARMGDTAQAAKYTLGKFHHPGARYPVFFETHYSGGHGKFCHLPDTDHGGVAMTALQEMIMQTDGQRILLGVAWPKEWGCDFKLRAPYETVVEGRVKEGRVVVDKVTPSGRAKDIEIFPLKEVPVEVTPLSLGKPASASSSWSAAYAANKAVDGDLGTRWASAAGKRDGWIEVDLGKPEAVGRIAIVETSYPRVSKFAVEAADPDGAYKVVAEGGAIGATKEIRLPAPVTAQKFRLHILDSKEDSPTIDEFSLFAK